MTYSDFSTATGSTSPAGRFIADASNTCKASSLRLPPGQTRFTDRAASAGATYRYRVRARTSRGATVYTETRRVSSAERASLITELRPSNYGLTPLGVGERYYIDRAYTLASFPSVLDGGLLIVPGMGPIRD